MSNRALNFLPCCCLLMLISTAGAAASAATSAATTDNQTKIFMDIRNETQAAALLDYLYKPDSRIRPNAFNQPTAVKIDFYVQSFGPLDEIEMEFDVDLDFRQTWIDPRLVFTSELDSPVYIPPQDINQFWIPDVYFPNEKYGNSHQITIPNKSLRIYKNGTIRYFSRLQMGLSCTMDLKTFPLDIQKCEIKISTYSYDSQEINLEWFDEDPIEMKIDELNLPQFHLDNFTHGHCNETYKTGNFTCLKATFILKRKVGFFVLQTYVPSILIVMLSWVGFWINKNSEPARVALGVTTVLTMTTQLTSSRSTMMRVSYLKAIDVWYSACMVFVFGALIEYAFVNVSVRNERKMTDRNNHSGCRENHDNQMDSLTTDVEKMDVIDDMDGGVSCLQLVVSKLKLLKAEVSSKNIDQMSRRAFPFAFLIFNVIYWIVYALLSRRT